MFNPELFEKLKSTKEFKKFSRNCYIGFMTVYIIAALLTAAISVICGMVNDDFSGFFTVFGISVLTVGAVVLISIYRSLKRTPYLCNEGTIVSKEGNFAVVEVNGEKFRGTSFEHFLKNSKLDNYKIGDKVLIYSGAKKNGRPLFGSFGF